MPAQIGTYKILREIGRGGMGAVYEALQSQPHRRVAVKLILFRPVVGRPAPPVLRGDSGVGTIDACRYRPHDEGGETEAAGGAQPYF